MSQTDPLQHLKSFYESLDAIPTPALTVKPPKYKGLLSLLLAPLAVSALAYGFMAFCASGSGSVNPMPVQTAAERFALQALREETTPKKQEPHAMAIALNRMS